MLNATLVAVTYMVLLERKVIAWAQSRLGPMRVGPYGILQPVADAVKLMIKEDITPVRADKWVFTAAPIISMVPALIVYAVIPFGPAVSLFGRQVTLYITDINVGLLYVVSVASVGVYGIILAGYASNSKYPLLASLRASAQLIQLRSRRDADAGQRDPDVRLAQHGRASSARRRARTCGTRSRSRWPSCIFFIGGLAETNRAPFDMPEAEQELTGGFHTEYSGMRFALFFLAEYANMIVVSSVATTLFLGGWLRPFPNVAALAFPRLHPGWTWFLIKSFVFLYIFIWVRATLPRYRYDQLMRLGWKVLIPLAIANLVVTGIVKVLLPVMGEAIAFYFIAACILGFAVLVVSTKDTVHSVLFLVLDFLFVAALYVLLGAPFLAAIQILVYAGGIVVLYLFVVMLVNLKRPPEAHSDPHRRDEAGVRAVGRGARGAARSLRTREYVRPAPALAAASARCRSRGNTEEVGLAALYELSDSVRDRVDAAAGRDDRRHRSREAGTMRSWIVIGQSGYSG